MKRLFFKISIVIFFLINTDADAQIRTSLFKNYSVEDGLTDKKVHCIYQDSDGWIWIGTDFGVVYYDGYKFTKLTTNDSESKILADARVRKIYEDTAVHKLYIATETYGMFILNTVDHQLKQLTDELSNTSLWDVLKDKDNNLWIATENGLNRYNPKSKEFKVYFHDPDDKNSLSHNWIKSLYIDDKDRLWVGTNLGLNLYSKENDNFSHFFLGEQYKYRENEIREIHQDTKGDFWVCTYLTGLHKYDESTGEFKRYILDKEKTRSNTARAIVEDEHHNLWIGTRAGLYVLDSTRQNISSYHHNTINEYSLVHNSIIDMFKDVRGDLWIGTRNGISFLNFNRQAFGHITSGNNTTMELSNGEVYCIWEDPEKNIWIGTESGGVHIFDRQENRIKTITQKDGLSNNCIKAIGPGKNGTVLIGTYLGGLNVYDPVTGQIKTYLHHENDSLSLSDNAVWTVYIDSKKRTWIGTSSGMDVFHQGKGQFVSYGNKFEVGEVANIYEDKSGNFWVYSNDKKSVTKIDQNQNITHHPYMARTIHEDNYGNMWFGTLGEGLVKFEPQTQEETRYTTSDGLSNDVIYGIVYHNDSILWMSTNHGLSRFNINSETFRNYFLEDGLINSEYNYGAYMKSSEGTLLFGGKRGLDFVSPEKIKTNKYVPPVVLTDFKIFNESINIGDTVDGEILLDKHISKTDAITIDYKKDMITFEFAALNYVNSNKNKYLYKLEGFDKSWNDGNNRTAIYTNLDAGTYQFLVKASNNDGVWTDEINLIQLTVTPPYWETLWFRLLIIGFVITAAIVFYFLRVITIQKRNKELEKLVQLRTTEISNKNEMLEHQKNELNQTNQQLAERQQLIEEQTAELMSQKEELQATNEQLSELNTMKDKFFSIIAHDLKNPINNILGLSDLLNVRLEKLSREKMKDYVDSISESARNTFNLLVNLLEWARSQSGRYQFSPEKIPINDLVYRNLQFFQEQCSVKGIQVEFKPDHQINVWADENMIDTVIRNIISNAIKFTPEKGQIFIDFKENKNPGFITVAITDTGVGIPSAEIPNLFKIDNNYSTKGTDGEAGTGLGLLLCAEFIQKHEGEIWLESEVNQGTTFYFSLPKIDR